MKILASLLVLLPLIANSETKFSNESEISVVQTGGNSVVETYNGKTLSKWTQEKRVYSFGGHYTLGVTEQLDEDGDEVKVESARDWDVNTKYEQVMSEKFNGYFGISVEGNEFSGIKQRENADLGGKYFLVKNDKTESFSEAGVRYTIEKTVTRNEDDEDVFNYTKGRVYYEIAHKKSEELSFKFWLEYLPNFTESKDYIVTYEPSVAFVLSSVFSLKTAYKAVYDNDPNVEGNENTDYTFTTSLIAKF